MSKKIDSHNQQGGEETDSLSSHHQDRDQGDEEAALRTTEESDHVVVVHINEHAFQSSEITEETGDDEQSQASFDHDDEEQGESITTTERNGIADGDIPCVSRGTSIGKVPRQSKTRHKEQDVTDLSHLAEEGKGEWKRDSNDKSNDNGDNIVVMVPPANVHVLPAEENAPSPDHQEQVRLWERLPVATPIFEAEVAVWDFERPKHHRHFGKGFFGNEEASVQSGDQEPRTRIFSQRDWDNPFRCVGKMLGIILALPLYILYKFVTLAWIPTFLRLSDCAIIRPCGRVLDLMAYMMKSISWCFYMTIMIPLYKVCLVYPCRILRYALWTCVTSLVKGIVWFYESCFFQGLLKRISSSIHFVAKCFLIPVYEGIVALPGTIYKYLIRPPIEHVVKPVWYGISKVVHFVWDGSIWCIHTTAKFVYNHVLSPAYNGFVSGLKSVHKCFIVPLGTCISFIVQSICNGIKTTAKCTYKYMLLPLSEGFVAGFTLVYKNLILPVAKCMWKGFKTIQAGVVSIVMDMYKYIVNAVWNGCVSGVACVYKGAIVPVFQTVCKTLQAAKTCVTSAAKFVHGFILVPIGNGIKRTAHSVNRNILVPTGTFLCNIVSFLGNLLSQIVTTLGNTLKEIVRQVGDFVSAVWKRIGQLHGMD